MARGKRNRGVYKPSKRTRHHVRRSLAVRMYPPLQPMIPLVGRGRIAKAAFPKLFMMFPRRVTKRRRTRIVPLGYYD